MGHNRGGDNAKRKKRRRLKQERRVAAKQVQGQGVEKKEPAR
jgi:hypothetical protein